MFAAVAASTATTSTALAPAASATTASTALAPAGTVDFTMVSAPPAMASAFPYTLGAQTKQSLLLSGCEVISHCK